MGRRSDQRNRRKTEAAATKVVNRTAKDKERARREARMTQTIRNGDLPYAPHVMSWLSRKLDKRATRITPEDVQLLLGKSQ